MGLLNVKKKLSETMLALLQCHKNIEIPDVHLTIDNTVRQIATEARDAGSKLTVDSFEAMAKDKEFLQSLTGCVDKWISEIRKITRLCNRDHIANNLLEEVNFWQCLSKALTNIDG